jgi:hypothetical protein
LFGGSLANIQGIAADESGSLYLSVQSDLKARKGYILKLSRKAPAADVRIAAQGLRPGPSRSP